jgi:hypothetical protein
VLTPVILVTQEAEIRKIEVLSQPRENTSQDPFLKKPITKTGLGSGSSGKSTCLASERH